MACDNYARLHVRTSRLCQPDVPQNETTSSKDCCLLAYRHPLGDILYSAGENPASNMASWNISPEHKQRFERTFSGVSVSGSLYNLILTRDRQPHTKDLRLFQGQKVWVHTSMPASLNVTRLIILAVSRAINEPDTAYFSVA